MGTKQAKERLTGSFKPQESKRTNRKKSPWVCLPSPAILTIDRLLVVWVHKMPWVLNGVLEVPDGMWTVPLTPHPFLQRFCLFLTFWKPVLLWAGIWKINKLWLLSSQAKLWGSLPGGFYGILSLKRDQGIYLIRKITISTISKFVPSKERWDSKSI